MPIVHDPHSGKFMPGPHAGGGGGGGGAGGAGGGGSDGDHSNPVLSHPVSEKAHEASDKAKSSPSKETHLAAAKAHSAAQQHHMNEAFDATGKTAEHHEKAAEYHTQKQQEHIKAAREAVGTHVEAPKFPASHPDPPHWEQSEYKRWDSHLSAAETKALRDYSGEGYKTINKSLRQDGPLSSHDRQTVEHLDTAIQKAGPLQENLSVFRSMPAGVLSSVKVGETYTDKGFMSTTMTREVAQRDWSTSSYGQHALVTIEVPKGASGAPLMKHSKNSDEHEFLLPRGSRMEITKKQEYGGQSYVWAKIVD